MDTSVGEHDEDAWLYETCTLALQLVVDLFVKFYGTVSPLLRKVLMLLVSFIRRPHQSLAGIGIAAFVRLMSNAGDLFSEDKWLDVVLSLKEAAAATLPDFSCVMHQDFVLRNFDLDLSGEATSSKIVDADPENAVLRCLYANLSDAKCRSAVQLLLIQAIMEIYMMFRVRLSAKNVLVLFEALHGVASQIHGINSDPTLRSKLQEYGALTQMQDPPLLRLETESYQICLTFLQNLVVDGPPGPNRGVAAEVESVLVSLCREILQQYIAASRSGKTREFASARCSPSMIPPGAGKRRELAARAPLVVSTFQALSSLEDASFERNLPAFFPLLACLVGCDHGSGEVQLALGDLLSSSVGPVLLRSC